MTARLADEWNYPATGLDRYDERRRTFDEHAASHNREVRRSTQIVFAPGDRTLPPSFEMFRPELGIRGSQDQMVDRVGQLTDLGLRGFYGFVPDEQSRIAASWCYTGRSGSGDTDMSEAPRKRSDIL